MTLRFPLLVGATSILLCTAAHAQRTPLRAVLVSSGLSLPVYVGAPPGDLDRLFVIEKNVGRIRVIKNGTLLPTPFLTISSRILTGSERGLLGMAFDPDYFTAGHPRQGWFYVSYTRAGDGASILERFLVSTSNPDVADVGTGQVAFGPVSQPFSNHNGGCIAFGPDGNLYFGLGDGGSGGDPSCNAQNRRSLLGKILRLDVSTIPFGVPADNPFVGDPNTLDQIAHLGVRNPWRFSFDRETGDLWIGDVGQNAVEEISYQAAGVANLGLNYGWRHREGNQNYNCTSCNGSPGCGSPALTEPVHAYPQSGNGCSVTGGYVYRGCQVPDLRGKYVFGDYCSGNIWEGELGAGGTLTNVRNIRAELGFSGSLSSFGEDGRGELLIVNYGSGAIYRIQAQDGGPARDLGNGKVGGNGEIPRLELCGRLEAGSTADLTLRNAPASAPSALVLSTQNNPLQIFGGTLVPNPPQLALPVGTTNGAGQLALPLAGGYAQSGAVLYVQMVLADSAASFGLGFSNALSITQL